MKQLQDSSFPHSSARHVSLGLRRKDQWQCLPNHQKYLTISHSGTCVQNQGLFASNLTLLSPLSSLLFLPLFAFASPPPPTPIFQERRLYPHFRHGRMMAAGSRESTTDRKIVTTVRTYLDTIIIRNGFTSFSVLDHHQSSSTTPW